MPNQEKMWYTIEEALNFLHLEERVFWRKITFFNLETRTLPGMKGTFLSRRDLLFVKRSIHELKNAK
jgi:hypothetical protein